MSTCAHLELVCEDLLAINTTTEQPPWCPMYTHTHTSHDHGPIQVPIIDGSKGCLKINEDEEPCYNQRKI